MLEQQVEKITETICKVFKEVGGRNALWLTPSSIVLAISLILSEIIVVGLVWHINTIPGFDFDVLRLGCVFVGELCVFCVVCELLRIWGKIHLKREDLYLKVAEYIENELCREHEETQYERTLAKQSDTGKNSNTGKSCTLYVGITRISK